MDWEENGKGWERSKKKKFVGEIRKYYNETKRAMTELKYLLWSERSRISSTGNWFIVVEGVCEEISENLEKKNRAVQKDGSED